MTTTSFVTSDVAFASDLGQLAAVPVQMDRVRFIRLLVEDAKTATMARLFRSQVCVKSLSRLHGPVIF
jgi:hypothetical protein